MGRLALWTLVALLLLRGFGAILTPPEQTGPTADQSATQNVADRVGSFAVRFARGYFTDPRGVARHSTPSDHADNSGPGVAQAEVVGARSIGPDESVVTVTCELTNGRVRNLAVPIRDQDGEITVLGAPYLVAGLPKPEFDPERGAPLSGPNTDEISKLVTRFISAYASTARPADLVYFVAPGTQVTPLGGFELAGDSPGIVQLDDGDTTRTVTAQVRLKDRATGSVYPVRYRLDLVKRQRWFVAGVQGAIR